MKTKFRMKITLKLNLKIPLAFGTLCLFNCLLWIGDIIWIYCIVWHFLCCRMKVDIELWLVSSNYLSMYLHLQRRWYKKIQWVIVDNWVDWWGSAPRLHPDVCPEANRHQLLRAARHLQTCVAWHGLGNRYQSSTDLSILW